MGVWPSLGRASHVPCCGPAGSLPLLLYGNISEITVSLNAWSLFAGIFRMVLTYVAFVILSMNFKISLQNLMINSVVVLSEVALNILILSKLAPFTYGILPSISSLSIHVFFYVL